MIPYIICCLVSTVTMFLSTRKTYVSNGKKQLTKINSVFFLLSIFVICFIAAVRDRSIGYDIAIYGDPVYNTALIATNIKSLFWSFGSIEPLYIVVAYLCAKLGNRYIYYFVIQLLVILPIGFTLKKFECKKYAWLGMLIYVTWLFPLTLNIMRQSIAVAITFWGYKYIYERKPIKYIITILIAAGFHCTAFIALSLYVIHFFSVCDIEKDSGLRLKFSRYHNICKLYITVLVIAISIGGISVITFISKNTGRFMSFVSDKTGTFSLEIPNLFFMFGILVIMKLLDLSKRDQEYKFMVFVIFLGMIIYQLKGFSAQLYRASLYFTIYMIYSIPYIIQKTKTKNKNFIIILLIVLYFIYFIFYIVYWKWHSVYPYTSEFLRIY